jgi:hypothetical protein
MKYPIGFIDDLALGILEPEDVCSLYGVPRETYLEWSSSVEFIGLVNKAGLELKASGKSIEAKARAVLEANLTNIHRLMNDNKVPASSKAQLAGLLADMAGEKKKIVGDGGEKRKAFVLNIHEGTNDIQGEVTQEFDVGDISVG